MPILADTKKRNIEFTYEWQASDEQVMVFPMKCTHSDNGPMVQISLGEQGILELPAEMFVEVADVLLQEGIVQGTRSIGPTPLPAGGKALQVPFLRKGTATGLQVSSQARAANPLIPVEPISNLVAQPEEENAIPQPSNEEIMQERMRARGRASAGEKRVNRKDD